LRRLYSTFARGWPGVGLLLLRLAVGIALIERGVIKLWNLPAIDVAALSVITAVAGLFLLAGLWTPIAGALVTGVELWSTLRHAADPSVHVLLATVGAALALLGPGALSVDARLFGWKRLDIRPRKSKL
jgi:uncharacterized membrane protein YphA (DoxX/SURF4 family)